MKLKDFIQKEPDVIKEKIDKIEKLSIFDILNAATINKTDLNFDDEYVNKAYDQYMINRWLSMDESLIFLAEMLTTTHNLSDKDHFNMIKSALPREKFYIKYMKRAKDLTETEKRYIAHYFEIGLNDAEYYIHQMSVEDINTILDTYRYGNNNMIQV